jgi:quinol monooxygenase YgiN
MIVLQVRIEAHPPQRRELVHALLRWAEAARSQPELDSCRLYEDLEEPGVFGLIAKWNDERALEAHLRSESFGVLQGAREVPARPARFEVLLPAVNPLLRRWRYDT